ncbi:MAG TPA: hypothetical protein VF173_32500 [Thermoanaerobaculia bacterium]|nr:hypothetical protein [Thermoanaerobaculia bacterium]
MSLVGALTPLGKVARDWKTWFLAVLLYTLSGLGVSAGVGAALGWLGRLAGVAQVRNGVLLGGVALALVLVAREWGLVRFRLPERPLQTEKTWMHEFGPLGAATLWGLHLSLGFFTRINYGGFWLLTFLALGLGDPVYGALLVGGHWLGKTLPVWVAPLAYQDPNEGGDLLRVWGGRTAVYARFQGLGLLAAAVVLAVWLKG